MERYCFPEEERKFFESLKQPFAIYQFLDKRVVTLVLSDGFCEKFGFKDRAQACYVMDNDMYGSAHPDDAARIANDAYRFASEGGTYEEVYRIREKDGDGFRIIHANGTHEDRENGVRLLHVWYIDEGSYSEDTQTGSRTLSDHLSRELHDKRLSGTSYYDYLTGLPSLTYFFELADAGREKLSKMGKRAVLLFIDLCGMKFFNNTRDFSEGDMLLREFAKLLVRTFSNENCCHIGGDHFAVVTQEEGIEETLKQLFLEAKDINEGDSLPVRVGIYVSQMADLPAAAAFDRAKIACDSIGHTYGSRFQYYQNQLSDDIVQRQYVLSNLDRALEEKWIQVYYQPIVRAVTGLVCDEEALARWFDPETGFLSPAEFIPVLEESGLIYKLDLYMLDRILEKIKVQESAGLYAVPQSLNLSRSDFDGCDIVEEIRKRVDEAEVPRDKITIEITESIIGRDFDFMKSQVERFQELGFPVWMDDFGSGYSSLDVLQSIHFDLIKFDMSFMQKLDEGESGKIVLTELMRMATALGVDTVCEGVETMGQVQILRELGCSKLQGFYFQKPIPMEELLARFENGTLIRFEDPSEAAYYETIGRVNLYDLTVISSENEKNFFNLFNTIPLCIVEVKDTRVRFVRSNQSYRDFVRRFLGVDIEEEMYTMAEEIVIPESSFTKILQACCRSGNRAFFDEKMSDGSTVHLFARRLASNSLKGTTSVAIAILSISEQKEDMIYADMVRALAADYYQLYYVDLDTDRYIEYSSMSDGEELSVEQHGDGFFASVEAGAKARIYEDDRALFLTDFTRENILHDIEARGAFTITYRLIDTGEPIYAELRVIQKKSDKKHIIVSVNIIDSQLKREAAIRSARRNQDTTARLMALTDDFLSLYIVDPETGRYQEFSTTEEYDSLGFAREGDDFFRQGILDGKQVVYPEDLPKYLEEFDKERILKEVREKGNYQQHYRLLLNGSIRPVSLRIALVNESDGEKLIAGVRAWKDRKDR